MSEQRKQFIVACALGPVGAFIAGGRRSRDLWYGSRLLSELTRQAALALQKTGAELLIPLEGSLKDFWDSPHQGPVIPNKILAKLSAKDAGKVRDSLDKARDRVLAFLADEVKQLATDTDWTSQLDIDLDALRAQGDAIRQGDFVEFYAAWAPITGDETAEAAAVQHVRDTLLAGRKAARDFPAPTWTKPGRPKCSLDPGRDSAMVEEDPVSRPPEAVAKTLLDRMAHGVRRDERLDAIGLLRRRAAFEETAYGPTVLPRLPFPPLNRVAADAWLAGAAAVAARDLNEVRTELDTLGNRRSQPNPLLLISSPCREPGKKIEEVGLFPYDPTPLSENGIQTLLREIGHPRLNPGLLLEDKAPAYATMRRQAADALNKIKAPVRRLHKRLGYPTPYYAMLEADGDDMGHILGGLTGKERQATVSALDAFARCAWQKVEAHGGFAFYIGGDELVAYVPVDKVLPLVQALSDLFRMTVGSKPIGDEPRFPTLSAGVVIAHQKEDMRAVRDWATAALREAKKQRKATHGGAEPAGQGAAVASGWLCVDERPAGGTPRRSVNRIDRLIEGQGQWRDLIASLGNDRDLSLATAHDLLGWAERFSRKTQDPDAKDKDDTNGVSLAQASLIQKLIRRDKDPAALPWLREQVLRLKTWPGVRQLANEILLADRIADVAAQRSPARGRTR